MRRGQYVRQNSAFLLPRYRPVRVEINLDDEIVFSAKSRYFGMEDPHPGTGGVWNVILDAKYERDHPAYRDIEVFRLRCPCLVSRGSRVDHRDIPGGEKTASAGLRVDGNAYQEWFLLEKGISLVLWTCRTGSRYCPS